MIAQLKRRFCPDEDPVPCVIGPTGRPRERDAKVRVSTDRKGALNMAAAELLTQEDEVFVALRKIDDDTIELRPLELPSDTLTVVQVKDGRFVYLGRFAEMANPGDVFDCDWMDAKGVMLCRRRK